MLCNLLEVEHAIRYVYTVICQRHFLIGLQQKNAKFVEKIVFVGSCIDSRRIRFLIVVLQASTRYHRSPHVDVDFMHETNSIIIVLNYVAFALHHRIHCRILLLCDVLQTSTRHNKHPSLDWVHTDDDTVVRLLYFCYPSTAHI